MNKGPVVTAVVALLAMAAVIGAFATNASPYVTIAQARQTSGDHLHLAGDLLKKTIVQDVKHQTLKFQLRDQDGAVVTVVHRGEMPANLDEANRIVAVGGMQGDQFVSHQLIVKCPSKYEGADSAKVAQN